MNHEILIEKENAIKSAKAALGSMKYKAKDVDWDFVICELENAVRCAKFAKFRVRKEYN